MARSLPGSVRNLIYAQETGDGLLTLLDIWDNTGFVQKFTNNSENIVYNEGDPDESTYLACPFEVRWPNMVEGKLTEAQLTIQNVDRRIIDEIRIQPEALKVVVTLVRLKDPTTVAMKTPTMYWRQLTYDAVSISGELSLENILAEPYPKDLMTATLFPGLFF